jgi:hypothetical protein
MSHWRLLDKMLVVAAVVSVLAAASAVVSLKASARRPTEYVPGDLFPSSPAAAYGASPKTLVIFTDSACKACIDSMPFYRDVIASKGRTRVVVVGTESELTLRAFVAAFALHPDGVASVAPGTFRFRGTPRLVLVDPTGHVTNSWSGRLLTSALEREVIVAVK